MSSISRMLPTESPPQRSCGVARPRSGRIQANCLPKKKLSTRGARRRPSCRQGPAAAKRDDVQVAYDFQQPRSATTSRLPTRSSSREARRGPGCRRGPAGAKRGMEQIANLVHRSGTATASRLWARSGTAPGFGLRLTAGVTFNLRFGPGVGLNSLCRRFWIRHFP